VQLLDPATLNVPIPHTFAVALVDPTGQ